MDFIGTGHRLQPGDVGEAARSIGIETAVLLTFIELEAAGRGFDGKNRPKILPERHRFWAELGNTAKRKTAAALGLAYPKWGQKPYPKSSDERFQMLGRMMEIDQDDALKSASWGLPQILGSNHAAAGFASPAAMVDAMRQGEREQLLAMVSLLKDWGLDKVLRGRDFTKASAWVDAVKRYNGPGYAKHNYHGRAAKAYIKHAKGTPMVAVTLPELMRYGGMLKSGMKGELVRNLQNDLIALAFDPGTVDGRFGANTTEAVLAFQEANGLEVDGKVGPITSAKLQERIAAVDDVVEPAAEWEREDPILMPQIEEAAAVSIDRPHTSILQTQHIELTAPIVVKSVQQMLRDKGYKEVGNVDGLMGPRTQDAITIFQRHAGLEMTGKITPELLKQLETAKVRPVSPERAMATAKDLKNAPSVKSGRAVEVGGAAVAIGGVIGGILDGTTSIDSISSTVTSASRLWGLLGTLSPWLLLILAGAIALYLGRHIIADQVQKYRGGNHV